MSEPEQQPVDPHAELYWHMFENMSKNNMLYDYLLSHVVKSLPNAQAVEDALNMMCIALSKTPLDSLLLIHEFLRNYHNIVQSERKTEQAEQESPFLGGQS